MSNYTLALFCHFLGLVALFAGYGMEWIISVLLRKAMTVEQVRAWLRVYRTSLPISGPGLLVLILSGAYLAAESGAMKEGWMSASMLAILLALGIGFMFILPRVRALRGSLGEAAGSLPVKTVELLHAPGLPTLIRVRALIALGIVYLMTVKPGTFAASLVALGVAIVLGLLASVGTFARPKAA
ncbi:MAG TPA: hypothetical protein VL128_02595 [Candidatus Eisenbacteria bacterium]|nr:hypothetical protein [Candidatus Eisenbacteria bacterium]